MYSPYSAWWQWLYGIQIYVIDITCEMITLSIWDRWRIWVRNIRLHISYDCTFLYAYINIYIYSCINLVVLLAGKIKKRIRLSGGRLLILRRRCDESLRCNAIWGAANSIRRSCWQWLSRHNISSVTVVIW